jgi:hypothetical protein
MCVLKKRTGGTEVSAASVPQTISRRLFATDQNTNTQFLIDTGADVSVVPAKFKDNSARNLAGFDLQSADGSAIKVFGQRTLSLNLGLRRPFLWTFIVASVTDAIIGADFLDNFELTVDIKNRKLCDPRTSLSIQCRTKNSNDIGIRAIFGDTDTQFQQLLHKYPDVIRPTPKDREVKHNVVHYIEIRGPPLHSKPRRLAPDKLKGAKEEFQHMLDTGIIQTSSSAWSSPLHMVPKPDNSSSFEVTRLSHSRGGPVALQTPRNKHQVERTPIPPPPRRADGTRVENDGISLSYPEDSTGPTSLHPHPNSTLFLLFESSKLLLNKTFVVVGSHWFTKYPNR